jgi:hypothetical protein
MLCFDLLLFVVQSVSSSCGGRVDNYLDARRPREK